MNAANKNVMNWDTEEVSEWVDSIARERETQLCGHIFEEKNIDGQRLWDYHRAAKLSEINVPSVGLKLILSKRIKTITGDDYQ